MPYAALIEHGELRQALRIALGHNMRKVLFTLTLRPLIKADYYFRAKGLLPDKPFWADTLAMRWGYFA